MKRVMSMVLALLVAGIATGQSGAYLDYCSYIGGASWDWINAVSVDHDKVAVAGHTISLDYPVTPGVVGGEHHGGAYSYDGVVTILDAASHALLASSYFGGWYSDYINDLACDRQGNVFIAGQTFSSDLGGTPGAFQPEPGWGAQGFVASLTPDLTRIRWLTYVDAPQAADSGNDQVYTMAVDDAGDVYVAGIIDEPDDFPVPRQLLPFRGHGYVLKLSGDAGALQWGVNVGQMTPKSIAVSAAGEVVVGGAATDSVRIEEGAFQEHARGYWDNYILALSAQDGSYSWSTFIGGMYYDTVWIGVTTDARGDVLFASRTNSPDYPVRGTEWGATLHGGYDIAVGRLLRGGRQLTWCGFLGGTGSDGNDLPDVTTAVALDDQGRLYIYSSTGSPDLPTTPGCYDPELTGYYKGMLAALDAAGGELLWLSYFGSAEPNMANDLVLRPEQVVMAGTVRQSDEGDHLPVTQDALKDSLTAPDWYDGYLAIMHVDDVVPTLVQSAALAWDAGTVVLHWRLSGEAAGLRAEVVAGGSVRELPLHREPDGTWTARDDQACAAGRAPRTYRLVLPGENRWTELWRREVTPDCATAGPLRLAARLLGGGAVELRLRSPVAGRAQVALYDLAGRRVAALPARTVRAGESVWEWEGWTDTGSPAPAGRYLARCAVAGQVAAAAVTLVR